MKLKWKSVSPHSGEEIEEDDEEPMGLMARRA